MVEVTLEAANTGEATGINIIKVIEAMDSALDLNVIIVLLLVVLVSVLGKAIP